MTPFSTFSSSYLAGEAGAAQFLAPAFRDPAARIAAARRASSKPVAFGLVEALLRRDAALPPSEARTRNIRAFGEHGTICVVTGQQVGLFLGPLYTFYKAASAIACAAAIERESGIRCVPVFWLQTEDHDYAEIDHCNVPSPGGATPLFLRVPGDDRRISVAQRQLGNASEDQIASMAEACNALPHAAEFLSLVRKHYRPDQSIAGAFAGLLATLFSDEGLILLDPRDQQIAKLAAPVHQRALDDSDRIAQVLLDREAALTAAGFSTQVHVRADSPLSFFHHPDAHGPRSRLARIGDRFSVAAGIEYSRDELARILERDPLRFSTSALLRPILQDTLLPTFAYVGGPGEINYFAQLPPLYSLFDLDMPLIAPRARFRIVDDATRSLLEKLGLSSSEVECSREALIAIVAAFNKGVDQHPTSDELRRRLLDAFTTELASFDSLVPSIDNHLLRASRRTRETVKRGIDRLLGKYERAVAGKDTVTGGRVDRLRAALFPDGEPQERVYSLPYYACRFGIPALKRAVFESLSPFDGAVRDLHL